MPTSRNIFFFNSENREEIKSISDDLTLLNPNYCLFHSEFDASIFKVGSIFRIARTNEKLNNNSVDTMSVCTICLSVHHSDHSYL